MNQRNCTPTIEYYHNSYIPVNTIWYNTLIMKEKNRQSQIPLPTIRRYPIYLRAIKAKVAGGEFYVSSAVLAEELGFDPVLSRKDLAMVGIPGKPRRGYPAGELCEAISHALGWDIPTEAAIVGVGSLGRALLGYNVALAGVLFTGGEIGHFTVSYGIYRALHGNCVLSCVNNALNAADSIGMSLAYALTPERVVLSAGKYGFRQQSVQ